VLEKLCNHLSPQTILEYVGQDKVGNSQEDFNEKRRSKRVKQGKQKLSKLVKGRIPIIPDGEI